MSDLLATVERVEKVCNECVRRDYAQTDDDALELAAAVRLLLDVARAAERYGSRTEYHAKTVAAFNARFPGVLTETER